SVVRSLNLKQGPTFFRISLEIFNAERYSGRWCDAHNISEAEQPLH
ncbi:unnamed protein product, partial [Allacma fusca]